MKELINKTFEFKNNNISSSKLLQIESKYILEINKEIDILNKEYTQLNFQKINNGKIDFKYGNPIFKFNENKKEISINALLTRKFNPNNVVPSNLIKVLKIEKHIKKLEEVVVKDYENKEINFYHIFQNRENPEF